VSHHSFLSRLFWIYSRVAHALYSRFPIFGEIKGAVAIIRRDGGYVVIDRNDGFGLGFPGGISGRRETPEQTVRREVREETGLILTTAEFRFEFHASEPFPNFTRVFEAAAEGKLHSSWEGQARVAPLAELQLRIVPQQRPILEYLLSLKSAEKSGG
jgi:8-oxo-dGTP pyrophosphatase MutT (NUDIX family)